MLFDVVFYFPDSTLIIMREGGLGRVPVIIGGKELWRTGTRGDAD